MKSRKSLFLPTLLFAVACTHIPFDSDQQGQSLPSLKPADFVAKAIAIAMQSEAVRLAVRDAMRASPMSEHKLQLQEYLTGGGGDVLLASIERSGIDRNTFLTNLKALPPLQFYVPARQQRLTWTGTPNVLISPNTDETVPRLAYAPEGGATTLHVDRGELPEAVLFVLQRAEPMHHRVWSQGTAPGNVIQDASDRDFGGARIYYDASGKVVRTVEFADLRQRRMAYDCGPEAFQCDEQSGGGFNSGLYLITLVNHGVCDNLCFFESLEFEFRTTSQYNSAEQVSSELTGIGQYDAWSGDFIISTYRPWNQWVEVGVWETDNTSGDDAFECQEVGPNWSACPNFLPRVQVSPGGTMSFALCQGLPWTCSNSPADIEVVFKDRP
jgi:hypothetical protein